MVLKDGSLSLKSDTSCLVPYPASGRPQPVTTPLIPACSRILDRWGGGQQYGVMAPMKVVMLMNCEVC